MKVKYKGHEIDVSREKCMGGWSTLYYSVFNDEGRECLTGFEDSAESVRDKIAQLKERIDNELSSDDPWGFEEGSGDD
ncbi:hypothetical protein FE848_15450 [Marinobacter sp. 1-3A]|uniref:hypothetical protein n=1 Tax=Marinobacter sp. 1-3A TaxID=2582920 RepID=UPI001906E470|nr:hypothetical protein [Marinobacter sp. 1-3A]MBK1874621.1 hypothetical protein [Marinobacter sp. 1-3A]